MDLEAVRTRWINYNKNLIEKFSKEAGLSGGQLEKLYYFGFDFLIDFESELEEDPENEDMGIITLDTVTAGYIDSFLGRWYIQQKEEISEKELEDFIDLLAGLYNYLKSNKLYKERAAQYTKLAGRLANKKKYLKRLREYQKIQKEKEDEEKYLDLMREWEYEDII